jgi:cytochrome c biogenesis protein CcmG/thiol:disulfide interchange protein DsbE
MLAVSAAGCDRGNHPSQIGKPAPTFALNDGSQSVDLAKQRGHVVVLVFWATWCAPCLTELPSLSVMQRQFPQIHVVTVSTDEDADAYKRFMTTHQVDLFSVRDGPNGANALYGSFVYPETYVIDKAGIVRRKFIGAQDWTSPEIVDFLKKLSA